MEDTKSNDGLKYIGNGTSLYGVPTRDLSEQEITERKLDRNMLLKSGLYIENIEIFYTPKPTKSAIKKSKKSKETQ